MKLSVGFLITFLFFAVPPLLIGQRSGELDETSRKEVAAYSREATKAAQAHDFAKAEEDWREVLEHDPHSAPALNNLGMVFYLEHKYPEPEGEETRDSHD